MQNPIQTLVIDNFQGSATPYINGSINSGRAFLTTSFGYDPFSYPGQLSWMETETQIDPNGAVITDMVLAGKVRVESGIVYVYAIGHTGRLYKIQVNDPASHTPSYDHPVLLATLTINSPTFTRGGFLDFFGATQKIYIGHDMGVTSINFDGTGEAFVGILGSWVQTVPRPLRQFVGKLYIGNGTNFAEIDSTATVTSYAKLSPSFPSGTQVRDLDVTPDGNYLQSVVAELDLNDITSTTTPTSILSTSGSYIFSWNGTDAGATSFVTYPGVTLASNVLNGESQYVFGYDYLGGGVYDPVRKLITSTPSSAFAECPSPNAVIGMANLVSWVMPLPLGGHTELSLNMFGTTSTYEIPNGYWSTFGMTASGTETDIIRIPCQILVSNFAQGSSSNGYTNEIFGNAKIYFSTLETSAAPTTKYKFYSWNPSPTGLGTALDGVYQTQTQLFSKKISISEVRVYAEPWVANNSFTVDLIGSDGNPITNGSKTLTAQNTDPQSPMYIGTDYAWYGPDTAPTYALGVRITNTGSANFKINKIEIDYGSAGK